MRNTYKLGFVSIPIPIILYLAFTIHATLAANYVPRKSSKVVGVLLQVPILMVASGTRILGLSICLQM